MATYVELKLNFQKLSEIEIFRKSKNFGRVLISIIIMSPWCYIWCCKQHNIIVAGFQQKCCFSATIVEFSCKYYFIQAKIENLTKKQHLLLENNHLVEKKQQWRFVAPRTVYSIRIIQKPIRCFAHFFDSCFGRIPWEFTKEKEEMLFQVGNILSRSSNFVTKGGVENPGFPPSPNDFFLKIKCIHADKHLRFFLWQLWY